MRITDELRIFIAEQCSYLRGAGCSGYNKMLEIADRIDEQHREEIVRCRDCKYYSDHEWVILTDVFDVCHFWHGKPTKVEADGFCKWGERR